MACGFRMRSTPAVVLFSAELSQITATMFRARTTLRTTYTPILPANRRESRKIQRKGIVASACPDVMDTAGGSAPPPFRADLAATVLSGGWLQSKVGSDTLYGGNSGPSAVGRPVSSRQTQFKELSG